MSQTYKLEYRYYVPYPQIPSSFIVADDSDYNIDEFGFDAMNNDYNHYEFEAGITLQVKGNLYAIVKHYLRDVPDFMTNAIEVRILDVECDKYIENLIIKPDGIKWCSDSCVFEINIRRFDHKIECLKRTLIDFGYDKSNSYWNSNVIPIHYRRCISVNKWTFYLGCIFVLFLVATPVLGWALLAFFGDDLYRLLRRAYGCDRNVQGILIRDYLSNVCNECGIDLSSETDLLFTNPLSNYHNDTIVFAPVNYGCKYTDTDCQLKYYSSNGIYWNGYELLENLNGHYNAKWQVRENKLLLASKYKPYNDVPLLIIDTQTNTVCCEWSGEYNYDNGDYQHSEDGSDIESQHVQPMYDKIINFNPSKSLALRESYNKVSKFARQNFRNTGFSSDENSDFVCGFGLGNFILDRLNIDECDDCMATQYYTFQTPRIVTWDGISNVNAKAIMRPYTNDELAYLLSRGYDLQENTYCKQPIRYNYHHSHDDYFSTIEAGQDFNLWNLHYRDKGLNSKHKKDRCEYKIKVCNCELKDVLGFFTGSKIDYSVWFENQLWEINQMTYEDNVLTLFIKEHK